MINFIKNCYLAGSFYAHHTTPRILHPIAIPLMAVTIAPVMIAANAVNEYRYEKGIQRKVAAHKDIGETEQSIRKIFGETSINGYTGHDDTIAMSFDQTSLALVSPDNRMTKIDYTQGHGTSRDKAAEDLVGRMAHEVTKTPMAADTGYKYYIAARNAANAAPIFCDAVKTDKNAPISENTLMRASYLGYGQSEDEREYYDIHAVSADQQVHLESLNI